MAAPVQPSSIVTKRDKGAGATEIAGQTFLAKPVKREELLAVADQMLGS